MQQRPRGLQIRIKQKCNRGQEVTKEYKMQQRAEAKKKSKYEKII
jgi:hypothetical protein